MNRPTKAQTAAWYKLQAAQARASQYRHPGERCERFGCESFLSIRTEYEPWPGHDAYQSTTVLVCSQGHHWGAPTHQDYADWRRG